MMKTVVLCAAGVLALGVCACSPSDQQQASDTAAEMKDDAGALAQDTGQLLQQGAENLKEGAQDAAAAAKAAGDELKDRANTDEAGAGSGQAQ